MIGSSITIALPEIASTFLDSWQMSGVSSDNSEVVHFLRRTIGKLTEGLIDFERKGGNLHSIMGTDASMPGKSAPHLTSSIDPL